MKHSAKRKTIIAAVVLAMVVLAVGCAPSKTTAQTDTTATAAATTSATTTTNAWASSYPLEYYSFANGGDAADDTAVIGNRVSFSHATMARFMKERNEKNNGAIRGVCISCKSSKFNELYAENGDDVFSKNASATYADLETDDYWDCGCCHSDMTNPAGSVGAQLALYKTVGATLVNQMDPKTAACAQCHNNANTWISNIDTNSSDAASLDPYRYGWDADGMMKAVQEDNPNAKKVIDDATGVYIYTDGGHPDAEIFQGSVMQKAGLSCTSCHMPTEQSVDGTSYSSHNSSGSPLESYSAMNSCLSCHKSQGIENVEQMKAYVKNAQSEVAGLDGQVITKLAGLDTAIGNSMSAGTASTETLDNARSAYATAAYYRAYVLGNNDSTPIAAGGRGEAPGEKVAHNPQMSREYLNRAITVIDSAMATLS